MSRTTSGGTSWGVPQLLGVDLDLGLGVGLDLDLGVGAGVGAGAGVGVLGVGVGELGLVGVGVVQIQMGLYCQGGANGSIHHHPPSQSPGGARGIDLYDLIKSLFRIGKEHLVCL